MHAESEVLHSERTSAVWRRSQQSIPECELWARYEVVWHFETLPPLPRHQEAWWCCNARDCTESV